MAPFLASQLVDKKQPMDAFKAAPQVVKVVTQPPSTPQSIKPPSSDSTKLTSAPQQISSQSGSSKVKISLQFRCRKDLLADCGPHSQEQESSSSC